MITEVNAKDRIRSTLNTLVSLLVCRDYVGLERMTNGVRLEARYIASGISEYGKTVKYPPESAFEKIDIVTIDERSPPEYSIRFRLYTEEEGASDLELQATFIDDQPKSGLMRVELDGIVVP